MKTLKITTVILLLAGFAFTGFNQTTIITPLTGLFWGGGNMTNSGASTIGMIPVYTDTSGTQVTPTNSLPSLNIGTLYFSGMTPSIVPVFSLNTNLVPSRTSTNILDYFYLLPSPSANDLVTSTNAGFYTTKSANYVVTNALAYDNTTNKFAQANNTLAKPSEEYGLFGHNGTGLSSGTGNLFYSFMVGGGRVSGAAGAMAPLPKAGYISRLYCHISATQGTGTNLTFTLWTNNVASPLTCTIAGGSTNANDVTHTTIFLPAGTQCTMCLNGNFASSYTTFSLDWGAICSN